MTASFPLHLPVGLPQFSAPVCPGPAVSAEFAALLDAAVEPEGKKKEAKKEEDQEETVAALPVIVFIAPAPPPPETAAAAVDEAPAAAAQAPALPAAQPEAPSPNVAPEQTGLRSEQAPVATSPAPALAFALRLTAQEDLPAEPPGAPPRSTPAAERALAAPGEAPPGAEREIAAPRSASPAADPEIAAPRNAPAPVQPTSEAFEPAQVKAQRVVRRAPDFAVRGAPMTAVVCPPAAGRAAPPAEPAPAAAPATPAAPEAPYSRAEPVRELSLSVPNQSRPERVELRVVERAGQVHVAVRSADPQLTHALRDQLGELVNRLEQDGYRAESWRPEAAGAIAAAPLPAAASDNHPDPGGGQGHSGFSGREDGRQQHQQQHRQPRPQWLEALERGMETAPPDARRILNGHFAS